MAHAVARQHEPHIEIGSGAATKPAAFPNLHPRAIITGLPSTPSDKKSLCLPPDSATELLRSPHPIQPQRSLARSNDLQDLPASLFDPPRLQFWYFCPMPTRHGLCINRCRSPSPTPTPPAPSFAQLRCPVGVALPANTLELQSTKTWRHGLKSARAKPVKRERPNSCLCTIRWFVQGASGPGALQGHADVLGSALCEEILYGFQTCGASRA